MENNTDIVLCESCSKIDFKRHINGDNGLRYRIRNIDMGSVRTLRERSIRCDLCRVVVQSFGSSAVADLRCHLYSTDFCMCPTRFSDEHDEALVCQHPKHLVFKLDAQPAQYISFQICLDRRANSPHYGNAADAVGLVEGTD